MGNTEVYSQSQRGSLFSENSKDYSGSYGKARPGHADYTAFVKYNGCEDYRGGGHFSGRITAALVAVGAVCISALEKKGISICTHIKGCAGVEDAPFTDYINDIKALSTKAFAVLNDEKGKEMVEAIEEGLTERKNSRDKEDIIEDEIIDDENVMENKGEDEEKEEKRQRRPRKAVNKK